MGTRREGRGRSLFLPALKRYDEGWRPAADVHRTRDGWLVKLDLAGVRPDEIQVRVRGESLTVEGVRRDWSVCECEDSYAMEIHYSRFERTLKLPANLEAAEMTTEYRDGMLLVRFHLERSHG